MTSASTATAAASTLSDAQYRALTGELLAAIERQVDRLLQDDVVDIDAARTGGLLELSFPDGSKIVVNTQPPLHEVWLAARRGGFHYRHVQGHWRDTKSEGEFFATLSDCASEQAGRRIEFAPSAAV